MEKKSFILYCDFKEQLDLLDYEEKGRLIEAIFDHECGEPIKDLPPMVKMAFASIRPHLVRNAKEWETSRKKRSEAGKKSGEARRAKREQFQTQLNNDEQCSTMFNNDEHNVNVNENNNDNENVYYYYYKGTDEVVDNSACTQIFVDNFGKRPTKVETENIKLLFQTYDRELIEDAFAVATSQGKKTLSYVKGILNRQSAAGIKNMGDLADYELKHGRV